METSEKKYQKHVFVCTNQRAAGQRVCCGETCGTEIIAAFKKALKERNLTANIRAQRAGCFDICESGPNVIVYPDAVYYGHVTVADVDEIVESHLCNNTPVERLKLRF